MIEIVGNLWSVHADWKGITTNGFVRSDGKAVMGRGVAAQAVKFHPELPALVGATILKHGNRVFRYPKYKLFTFPVKHHWQEQAAISLIASSARQLGAWARKNPRQIFVLPRPGCGNGRREWSEVKPIIEYYLPDNVRVIAPPLENRW